MDAPYQLSPDVHIFTRGKHPAMVIPPGLSAFEEYYDRGQVWPAESLARMGTNIGAHSHNA